MAFLFPRVAYGPARCGVPAIARNDFAPLFSLFDDSLNELHRASRQGARKSFNPRFDIKEAKDSYSVEAEVPGIEQKDLSIEFVDEHTLTIKGRSQRHVESGSRTSSSDDVVEASSKPAAVEEGENAADSEAESSSKSHQPTVEDEEAPAAASSSSSAEVAAAAAATAEPETQNRYWISERRVGEFSRSFRFDARVDQDAVKASLKNGILSIVIPKAAVPESRRVQIE